MPHQTYQNLTPQDLSNMTLEHLRRHWSDAWKLNPHKYISRRLLMNSLLYKIREVNGQGLSHDQQQKLDQLVKSYKRSRTDGSKRQVQIKAGTQLIREWNEQRHVVTVMNAGFEYREKVYSSLSAIASEIAGTRWNGWVFFGVKNPFGKRGEA